MGDAEDVLTETRKMLDCYNGGVARGAAEERARIVRWLRIYAHDGLAQSYADAIERGEHEEGGE